LAAPFMTGLFWPEIRTNDQNWSAMITFDHASNGSPTLSNCRGNTGISVVGLRVGYAF
jgi:hypothetical protein